MRNLLIAAGLAVVALAGAGAAPAQAGPWCQLDPEWIVVNCSYVSLQQCWETIHGVGGNCVANVYEPAPPPRERRRARARH